MITALLTLQIFLLIWLAFAVATMKVAQQRGLSGGLWLLVGLLLGAFGLILALLWPEPPPPGPPVGTMRACPFCRADVPRDATVCRYCERDLPALKECPHTEWGPGRLYFLEQCRASGLERQKAGA